VVDGLLLNRGILELLQGNSSEITFLKPPFNQGSALPLVKLTLVVGAQCTFGSGVAERLANNIHVHPGWTGCHDPLLKRSNMPRLLELLQCLIAF
jgi:hypothetical protein